MWSAPNTSTREERTMTYTRTITPTPSDWLKYVRAQGNSTLNYVTDWLAGCADLPDDSDAMCEALDSVRALIDEATLDDPDHYSDGRRVWTELDDPRFPLSVTLG